MLLVINGVHVKYKVDGQVDEYKVHLVAKGYSQVLGIDYIETFSLVVKLTFIRIIMAFATKYNYEVHQMDIKAYFLNGEFEGKNYMKQPKGFVQTSKNNLVCKLNKNIYALNKVCKLNMLA
jgi:hypothetical protein